MIEYAFLYFAAHMLADFPLQTDEMASRKFDEPFYRVDHCMVHLFSYVAVGLILQLSIGAVFAISAGIALLHFVIDSRRWAEPKNGFEDYPIWVDQTLHIVSIAIVLLLV